MNSNKQAFPHTEIKLDYSREKGRFETKINHEGISKREYFAGLAMQGILSKRSVEDFRGSFEATTKKEIVGYAIKLADELLKQLEHNL